METKNMKYTYKITYERDNQGYLIKSDLDVDTHRGELMAQIKRMTRDYPVSIEKLKVLEL